MGLKLGPVLEKLACTSLDHLSELEFERLSFYRSDRLVKGVLHVD